MRDADFAVPCVAFHFSCIEINTHVQMLEKFTYFIFKHNENGGGGTFIVTRHNRCLSSQKWDMSEQNQV